MTIGKKIIGGYLVVLALLGMVVLTALYAINRIEKTYGQFVDVDLRLVDSAARLRAEAGIQAASYRAALLFPAARTGYLGELEASRRRFAEVIEEMLAVVRTEDGPRFIREISDLQSQNEAAQDRVLATGGAAASSRDRDIEAVRQVNDRLIALTDAFRQRQLSLLGEERKALEDGIEDLSMLAWLAAIVGLVAGLGIGGYLSRAITRQLGESVMQLSASAAEILATTSQVASGAAETATAVSETTATVEEVKQTAQVASQKAKYVSESAQRVTQVSAAGRKSVDDTISGMQRIRDQMQSIAESIVRLNEQSQAIGEIISTVSDLAEQSNLLAVNAAIEAARAGEQGKGFAVVAQEVRSLAEQSKQGTAQVRGILGEIQKATSAAVLATEQGSKAVETGVQRSAEAGESIRQLADSVTEAAQAAIQIAASSQQQMIGMDQVAIAMENIKQASAQNVSGTKQAETAAQGLHELGSRLGAMIGSRSARG